jgi:hypothetical protein
VVDTSDKVAWQRYLLFLETSVDAETEACMAGLIILGSPDGVEDVRQFGDNIPLESEWASATQEMVFCLFFEALSQEFVEAFAVLFGVFLCGLVHKENHNRVSRDRLSYFVPERGSR